KRALQIRRGQVPKVKETLANQRPAFDLIRRRGDRYCARAEALRKLLKAPHHAQSEPNGRPGKDQKADHRDDSPGELPAPAQQPGDTIKCGIKSDGENEAPKHDREKRTYNNIRPIGQESKQANPDDKLE